MIRLRVRKKELLDIRSAPEVTRYGGAFHRIPCQAQDINSGEREQNAFPAERTIDCSERTTAQRGKKRLPVRTVSAARPTKKRSFEDSLMNRIVLVASQEQQAQVVNRVEEEEARCRCPVKRTSVVHYRSTIQIHKHHSLEA